MPYRYHYDPNQPRLPAGQHEGGEWTNEGIADPSILQRVQYIPPGPGVTGLVGVLALFGLLSLRNGRNERAILQFNARQYDRVGTDAFSAANIRLLDRDEVNRVCKRLEEVQMMTDSASLAERPFKNTMSPTQYGLEMAGRHPGGEKGRQ